MSRLSQLFTTLLFVIVFAAPGLAQSSFPNPPLTPQRLFYVQRTGNTNTIVYDANTLNNGKTFHKKQPINVYWLRYDEQGQVAPLNYLQRTMAYGVTVNPTERSDEFEFHVVSYPKRKLRLVLDPGGRPHAIMTINNQPVWLNRVFVKIEGMKVGIIPNVKYVELFGTDPKTGKGVYEKFVP